MKEKKRTHTPTHAQIGDVFDDNPSVVCVFFFVNLSRVLGTPGTRRHHGICCDIRPGDCVKYADIILQFCVGWVRTKWRA